MKFLATLFLLASTSCAQAIQPGKCPDFVPKTDFQVAPYLGKWFEYARIPTRFEAGQTCNYAEYSDNGNGTVEVHNAGLDANGDFEEIYGYAETTDVPGYLHIHLDGVPFTGDYNVLDTDYETFAAVYACKGFLGLGHVNYAWILTRNATISQESEKAATGAFEKWGIDPTSLIQTKQDPCDFP